MPTPDQAELTESREVTEAQRQRWLENLTKALDIIPDCGGRIKTGEIAPFNLKELTIREVKDANLRLPLDIICPKKIKKAIAVTSSPTQLQLDINRDVIPNFPFRVLPTRINRNTYWELIDCQNGETWAWTLDFLNELNQWASNFHFDCFCPEGDSLVRLKSEDRVLKPQRLAVFVGCEGRIEMPAGLRPEIAWGIVVGLPVH